MGNISNNSSDQVVNKTVNNNVIVKEWSSLLSAVREKHAPIRKIRVSDRNCPWINKELKLLMKSRDKLKKTAIEHKSQVLMAIYKKFGIKLIPLMFG